MSYFTFSILYLVRTQCLFDTSQTIRYIVSILCKASRGDDANFVAILCGHMPFVRIQNCAKGAAQGSSRG